MSLKRRLERAEAEAPDLVADLQATFHGMADAELERLAAATTEAEALAVLHHNGVGAVRSATMEQFKAAWGEFQRRDRLWLRAYLHEHPEAFEGRTPEDVGELRDELAAAGMLDDATAELLDAHC